MAQGKLKVKTKLPKDVKKHQKTAKKGSAISKRANRPVQSKKKAFTETHRLKQAVHKTVNKAVEEEMRSKAANDTNQSLSKVQQAVAEYHKKAAT